MGVTPSLVLLETTEPSAGVHISVPRYGSADHDSIAPILPEESTFRHSGWAPDRRRIFDSLTRVHEPQRRLQAFADCGSSAWARWDENEPCITCNLCRDRLCVPCQSARRARLIEAILVAIVDAPARTSFLTFTLKHNHNPLKDQIDRLYTSFRTLRRRPIWKSAVTGGALFLEVKLGKDGLWHPHLHVICQSEFIDQKSLSMAWYAVTGDSFIVDIQRIKDPSRRASYVTKYATKPADSSVVRVPDRLDEFVCAIKGRRLYQPFGDWRALLPADDDSAPVRLTIAIGSLSSVAARAASGDHACRLWWSKATLRWPHLLVFWPKSAPGPTDPAPP